MQPAEVTLDTFADLESIRSGPRSALLWSIIPGGGQAYNKRWWKVPLVYGGLLGAVAYADFNQTQFERFDDILDARCLGEGNIIVVPYEECQPREAEFPNRSSEAIELARKSADRARQTAYIAIAVVYILQGVEAYTDAHLQNFDIDDDLSIRLGPINAHGCAIGYGLTVPLGSNRHHRRQLSLLRTLPRIP